MTRAPLFAWLMLAASCASTARPPTGVVEGHLTPCPAAPKCVSTEATDARHAVAPFMLVTVDPDVPDRIAAVIGGMERTTIVERNGGYLRAEVISPWHVWTDDLELLIVPETSRLEVRSSARVGYYDFRVNRKRVEALRQALFEAGLIRGPG